MRLLLKNLLFTVLVPGTVAVYLPLMIAERRFSASGLISAIGCSLLALGLAIYAWCVWDFATFGRGTPAPIDAPKKLVVRGLYQYTRNPMYAGVLTIIMGWALYFQVTVLFFYALAVGTWFHLFVVLYEERHLQRVFGAEYEDYCARVGRWLPRFRQRASQLPVAADGAASRCRTGVLSRNASLTRRASMPPRLRLMLTALSLALFLVSAAPLYRALSRPSDIWWTPQALLVPLAESADRVEIYVRGKPLATLVQAGQLRITENGGSSTLSPSDVGVRFNNWDRVRVGQLPLLLGYAAMCGVTAGMFLLAVSGRLAYRGERGPGTAL